MSNDVIEAFTKFQINHPDGNYVSFSAGWVAATNIKQDEIPQDEYLMAFDQYLKHRHPTVIGLTAPEARLLGIPYPLQSGWVEKYAYLLIGETLLEELIAARESRRERNSEAAKKKYGKRNARHA